MISIPSAVLSVESLEASSVVSGDPVVSNIVLWSSDDGGWIQGIWEMTPGVVTDTEADEIFVVHSGKAKIRIDDRDEHLIGPDSVGMFRSGTKTVWTVLETLRKAYSITKSKSDPQDVEMKPCVATDAALCNSTKTCSVADTVMPCEGFGTNEAKISSLLLWQSREQSHKRCSRRRDILEAAPGVTASPGMEEFFVVVTGRATIEVEGRPGVAVGPGSVGMLPKGARATWTVHETLRRVRETRSAAAAAAPAASSPVTAAAEPALGFQRSSL